MELEPQPISTRSYHDARLKQIAFEDDGVSLTLQDAVGKPVQILLARVVLFFITDLLADNLIERVDCREITAGNLDSVLEMFERTGSEYLTRDSLDRIRKAKDLLGLKFLSLHPTYGAYLIALCDDVVEGTPKSVT
jgi:hypothetical protein